VRDVVYAPFVSGWETVFDDFPYVGNRYSERDGLVKTLLKFLDITIDFLHTAAPFGIFRSRFKNLYTGFNSKIR
jgi:hypothetical protein